MSRFGFPAAELRRRTLRGAAVTGAFLAAIDGLVLIQGLVVTRLLGPEAIGLYGVVSTTVISLIALKRIGIDEAFVAQEEPDQEAEFQHAFTLELILAAAMTALICVLAPLVAAVYRDGRLTALMLGLAYLPLAFALQAPLWIFFRRMEYSRQRSLQAIQPLVSFVVTIALAAATDLGVWSLIVGQVAGYAVAVSVTVRVSPYRLALRLDRAVAARYVRFSGPILLTVLATLIVAQGQTLLYKLDRGLTEVGFLTLAVTLTRYIDRADQIVTATIYPAICAIQDRTRALEELFEKSNRATLIWVMPYATGIVLFAPDLTHFVLGRRWDGAVVLLQGLAIVGAITQLGFNWFSFFRARGETRPPAIEALTGTAAFLALCVPALLVWGPQGFVAGRVAGALLTLAVRRHLSRRLLPRVSYLRLLVPSLVPLVLAGAAVGALRLALWGERRTAGQSVAELVLFCGVYAAAVLRRERELLGELLGALRSRRVAAAAE